jgi:hypothetical protein
VFDAEQSQRRARNDQLAAGVMMAVLVAARLRTGEHPTTRQEVHSGSVLFLTALTMMYSPVLLQAGQHTLRSCLVMALKLAAATAPLFQLHSYSLFNVRRRGGEAGAVALLAAAQCCLPACPGSFDSFGRIQLCALCCPAPSASPLQVYPSQAHPPTVASSLLRIIVADHTALLFLLGTAMPQGLLADGAAQLLFLATLSQQTSMLCDSRVWTARSAASWHWSLRACCCTCTLCKLGPVAACRKTICLPLHLPCRCSMWSSLSRPPGGASSARNRLGACLLCGNMPNIACLRFQPPSATALQSRLSQCCCQCCCLPLQACTAFIYAMQLSIGAALPMLLAARREAGAAVAFARQHGISASDCRLRAYTRIHTALGLRLGTWLRSGVAVLCVLWLLLAWTLLAP